MRASKTRTSGKKNIPIEEDTLGGVEPDTEDAGTSPADGQDLCETEAAEDTPTTQELQERLEAALRQQSELQDRLLRNMAEFDNFKKRVAKEKEDLVKYGTERFAFEVLAVVDNLERAIEQARNAEDTESIVEGVEMILKQFIDVLEKFHITGFGSVGEPFDPERHEAMAQQEHDEYADNTVINEYQKGYTIHNKLLRPARVIVSKEPMDKAE